MRLTLRTMLAYLDDVLSEADAHDLSQKIDSSDFATGLVHRIRNSISRLRLSSPDLLGSDSMDDPNSVAEFIDSSLSPEKEQEFEKVCLQSDKHLAEVASCHQILTLVLGTPARVEPRLRDRIYRTGVPSGESVAPVSVGPDGQREPFRRVAPADAAQAADVVPVEIKRPRRLSDSHPNLAEFGKRRNLWPIAAAILLGFLLTGGFMVAMGPLDGGHPLAGVLGLRDVEVEVAGNLEVEEPTLPKPTLESPPLALPAQDQPDRDQPGTEPDFEQPALVPLEQSNDTLSSHGLVEPQRSVAGQPPEERAVDNGDWVLPEFPTTEDSVATSTDLGGPAEIDQSPDVLRPGNPEFDDPEIVDPLNVDADEGPLATLVESDAIRDGAFSDRGLNGPGIRDPFDRASLDSQPNAAAAAAPVEVEPNEPPTPDREIGIPGLDDSPLGIVDDLADASIELGDSEDDGAADPQVAREEQPIEVGRFLSEGQVLLYWDDQTSAWLRLPPRTAFGVGHRLRTLEIFRPQLLLSPGNIQITSRGNSDILFVEPIDAQTPTFELPFGRLLLNSTGQENARVAMRVGERVVIIDFSEPDTEVVCQVQPIVLPGLDPRQEPLHQLMRLWVTRGSAKIGEQGSEYQVDMGNQFAFADDMDARVMGFNELPGWLHNRVGELDRDAAVELESLLPVGRDVVLSLSESADNRRTDVRTLAARYLVSLDQYRVGVSLFSVADRKNQFAWPALFHELQVVLGRGPESANAVYETFEGLYGPDGGKLYRMLLGFDNEQLDAGAAEQLVEDLDNPRVEFRILAIQNLQRMTGKTLLYGPVQSEKHRSSKITRWRNELKKGKVTVRTPPEDLVQWQQLSVVAPALP